MSSKFNCNKDVSYFELQSSSYASYSPQVIQATLKFSAEWLCAAAGLVGLGKRKAPEQTRSSGRVAWKKKESRTIDNGSGSTIEQVLKINW